VAADNPRIQELRRRVDKDPASIAFAQLAEEYRRAGDAQEAVRVCRAGLVQHPTYVFARVTLGRALMELGKLDEARGEFEHVLVAAPDNLVAVRSMAELYQLRGETAPTFSAVAEGPAEPPPLPETALPFVVPPPLPVVEESMPVPGAAAPPIDLDAAIAAFDAAFSGQAAEPTETPAPGAADLESWLANIVADRDERKRPS
jgi:Tfp pilus assembly protein PilF